MSFSLGISKWGWFHAPVIRANEWDGGHGMRQTAGCAHQPSDRKCMWVYVVISRWVQKSTFWNERTEAGKDREKTERGGEREGLVQVCLCSLFWRVRSGERRKAKSIVLITGTFTLVISWSGNCEAPLNLCSTPPLSGCLATRTSETDFVKPADENNKCSLKVAEQCNTEENVDVK